MSKFLPYKNIKELYNPERLVMPAIRDQILNSIFLGKASEKGETLLDNQNYPFFDLWAYCINHYRYSFWETIRGELLVTPDTMSCLPPPNNIIFTDNYIHYGRSVKLRGLVTRFFEPGFFTTPSLENGDGLNSAVEMAQEAFVAPTSDLKPEIADIIKAECMGIKLTKDEAGDEYTVNKLVPMEEEFHYGANFMTGDGEYLLRMGENLVRKNYGSTLNDSLGQDGEDSINLVEEYNNFHKLNVLNKYFLTRLQSQKTPQIRLTFSPRLVPGLPVLLLSRSGRHSFGLITSINHTIDANGVAETNISVEYQYLFDDATKRPLYFYRDKRSEEKLLGDEDSYVWKNYFMLSSNFRDKYIGTEIYSKILFDGISETDYNPFASKTNKILGKGDKSILCIHKLLPNISNNKEQKESLPEKKVEEKEFRGGAGGLSGTTESGSTSLSFSVFSDLKNLYTGSGEFGLVSFNDGFQISFSSPKGEITLDQIKEAYENNKQTLIDRYGSASIESLRSKVDYIAHSHPQNTSPKKAIKIFTKPEYVGKGAFTASDADFTFTKKIGIQHYIIDQNNIQLLDSSANLAGNWWWRDDGNFSI